MRRPPAIALVVLSLLGTACSSPSPSTSGAGASGTSLPPAATTESTASDPAISLTIPTEVEAGKTFDAAWTGQETSGDFFVIVPAGSTTWTESADSPYVNATIGNPAKLTAPKTAGAYEVWFLKGDTEGPIVIKARAPLSVK